MTETHDRFRVVLRGYDPAQVDRRVHELTENAQAARQQVDEVSTRVRQLEAGQVREPAEGPVGPPSFTHLGDRVGQILTLAEQEADEIRGRAHDELDSEREEFAQTVARVRDEADRYAKERRSDADTESARVLEDARRTADDRLDAADRDASARLQEAEAVYEEQRAKAAQAAADFETTLASRRKESEREFTQQMTDSQKRLEQIEAQIEAARAEAESSQADAIREARQQLEEAQQKASSIVNDAKTVAARVRADSERELSAATQRRDSINAQLANVRQMLATLTGGAAPAGLVEDAFGGPDGEAGEQSVESDQAESDDESVMASKQQERAD